jgi:hypothetical protein
MKVYVAAIPLKYEVIAVASTEATAIEMASRKAFADLKKAKQIHSEINTPARLADYFGVNVTAVTVGGPGVCVGDR